MPTILGTIYRLFSLMSILALTVTALLLPLVLVMVWRCWNLLPVPEARWWALGFGGMSLAMLAQMWRAELWKNRFDKLERQFKPALPRFQPKRLSLPKTKSFCYSPKFFFRSQGLLDAGACFLLPENAVQFLTAPPEVEPGIVVRISVLADRYQKTEVGLRNIVHTQLAFLAVFGEHWQPLLPLLKIGLHQPCPNVIELLLGNREPILSASWQSETLIKRLWSKSKRLPILSQSVAMNWWNPMTSSVSFATLKNAYESHLARSLSSRPEKFNSCFF